MRIATRKLVYTAAVAGAVMVTMTAYYGGQLVFELGVNVVKVASLN